jgi:hypothetical protein
MCKTLDNNPARARFKRIIEVANLNHGFNYVQTHIGPASLSCVAQRLLPSQVAEKAKRHSENF